MTEAETFMGVYAPTTTTLKKYGATVDLWKAMLEEQGGACGACSKLPKTGRLVIDHEHVRGWKDMAQADRWQYVRGLLCWSCNHYRLARGATVANLLGASTYLWRYEQRRVA